MSAPPRALGAALPGPIRTLPIDSGSTCTKRPGAFKGVLPSLHWAMERLIKRVQVQGGRQSGD